MMNDGGDVMLSIDIPMKNGRFVPNPLGRAYGPRDEPLLPVVLQ
jgi:hypothetical protein